MLMNQRFQRSILLKLLIERHWQLFFLMWASISIHRLSALQRQFQQLAQLCLLIGGEVAQQLGGNLLALIFELGEQLLPLRAELQAAHALVCLAGRSVQPTLVLQLRQRARHLGFVGVAVLDQLFLRNARVAACVHQDAELIKRQPRLNALQRLKQARAKLVHQVVQHFKHIGGKGRTHIEKGNC